MPSKPAENIDDFLKYFAQSLGRDLTLAGQRMLLDILQKGRDQPRQLFLYVDQKRKSSAVTDAELEEKLTEFYSRFC